jgi:hypothetical protein
MKVWEKVAKEMSEEFHHEYTSKSDVCADMYMLRVLPCDCNDEFHFITGKSMDDLCNEMQLECQECLSRWLDMEAEQ